MRITTRHLLLALLLAPAGCSSLDVSVAVLNTSYRNSPAFIEANATTLAARARQVLASYSQPRIDGRIRETVSTWLNEFRRQQQSAKKPVHMDETVASTMVQQTAANASQNVADAWAPVAAKLTTAIHDESAAVALKNTEQRADAFIKANNELIDAINAWHAFRNTIPQSIAASPDELLDFLATASGAGAGAAPETRPAPDAQFEAFSAQAQTKLQSAVSSALPSLTSNDILDDPFASVVINAPPEYWQGIYNKTFGQGTLGDTDIAIRMESVGDFTVKGVRDDASKITSATFQGVQQSIQIAAAIYGVKLPGSGSNTSTGSGAASTSGSKTTSDNTATAAAAAAPGAAANPAAPAAPSASASSNQQAEVNARLAALTLLSSITTNRAAFDPAALPADVAKAVKAVNDSYAAEKSDLGGD